MTDETKPTTEEFLKLLEEAKAEWKRYNTMREAAPDMLEALKSARMFIMSVPEAVTVSGRLNHQPRMCRLRHLRSAFIACIVSMIALMERW